MVIIQFLPAEGGPNRCLRIENIKAIQLYFIGFNGDCLRYRSLLGLPCVVFLSARYVFCKFNNSRDLDIIQLLVKLSDFLIAKKALLKLLTVS